MISYLNSDQPLARETMMCQNETEFFDNVWAYFLHDYDNVEDDVFSAESLGDILSDDGYESHRNEELDATTNDGTRYASLENYSQHSAHEDYSRHSAQEDEAKFAAFEKYARYNLPRDGNKKPMVLDASLQRTVEILEYARKLEAAKKKAAKKRVDQISKNREYNLQDNKDTNSFRIGPPQTIYVHEGVDNGSVNSGGKKNSSASISPSGVYAGVVQRLFINDEKQEDTQNSSLSRGSNGKIDEIIAKRKELYRRIALLRIKAAKVRMIKTD